MSAPDSILQLVEHFETHRRAYLSQEYNETQVRREFLDPFFEALGWDVFNKSGYAPAYKDVIHEDAIKMGGATKAPDYAFRIGGTRKFFVEAKKPAVKLRDEISPAYQLRRYAWSAKLPLSILTDFEEFTVYDCRLKPALIDKPSTGRIQLFTYRDYSTHWDEIASVFSRQAVLKGSFDQYAEAVTGKHGTAEVDHAFLAEIERWRDLLAHNIALRNPSLTQRDLNYAVQMTIDRLIFLRICEDRGIEFYGQLQALLNGADVYPRLCQLFRNADDRYNSGLFHFRAEKGQADPPDALSLSLALDDKPLKDILGNLYYPDSPYEFSVLPTEILGQVYEQFLGKVIRLTSAHHAVVEDKPEVKKAGGVFYTPTFIVDYIVKNTLGKLLEGKAPGQVGLGRGAPNRVLDMACGSGSFLLGAYQYLLDWYLNAYTASEPEKYARGRSPQLVQVSHGEWRLTTSERKRILLDHIYGVDIDPQAVEVTKLSLLLKVLEGESQDTVGKQLSLFHQRALPDLGQNIKCGNSLIGPDFYASQQSNFLDDEEQRRINAFDWQKEFPQVFTQKARLLWLVTFVTHNSRISERMVTYGVKSGDPLILDASDRLLIAQSISAACHSHNIPVVAWNVLPDHIHMILAAEDEQELDEQVGKIKGFSSFSFQRARGSDEGGHVWAQKYHHLLITDQRMLENAYSYVMDNHIKHAEQWGQELIDSLSAHLVTPPTLPPSSSPTRGLSPLLDKYPSSTLSLKDVRDELCVTPEKACQPLSGGFDVIIGNPPYIHSRDDRLAQYEKEYYFKYYHVAEYQINTFVLFIEKGLSLLKQGSVVGMIIPNYWLATQYDRKLRQLIFHENTADLLVNVYQVFPGATVDTLIFIGRRSSDTYPKQLALRSVSRELSTIEQRLDAVRLGMWAFSRDIYIQDLETDVLVSFSEQFKLKGQDQLGMYFELRFGMKPYQVGKGKPEQTKQVVASKLFEADYKLDKTYLPLLRARNIKRYKLDWQGSWIKYGNHLAEPRTMELFTGPRILVQRIVSSTRLDGIFITDTFVCNTDIITLKPRDTSIQEHEMKFFLGLLVSKAVTHHLKSHNVNLDRQAFPKINTRTLLTLPIPSMNFLSTTNKSQKDRMVALVEHMLSLHQQLAAALTPTEKNLLQRHIASTDRQIDALVYELYGLTEDEIKLVEGR